MKKIIQFKLKILAKIILAKYKPEIIGITGSVGKTSAKEAVYAVLSANFRVRRNIKNYNNEIGLPLTIIGAISPRKNIFGWIWIFLKALKLILIKDKKYPEILVLEMGVDRPGDMKYLLSITKCNVAIATLIGASHIEYFGSINEIQKEKSSLVKSVISSGWSILNYDDEMIRRMADISKAKVITYGFGSKADVKAQEINFSFSSSDKKLNGISFKLIYKESFATVILPNVIGKAGIYAALAGAAVGIAYRINLVKISESLNSLKLPNGRMKILNGIKNTFLIDDTYNSSPQSSISALNTIKDIPILESARKFVVLGDMLELGNYTEEGHREVGRHIFKIEIDQLITVGEKARDIARGAKEAGMDINNIFSFPYVEDAGKFIQDRICESDLILVKGSQAMRMEKIVKEIMAEPLRAKELLVRQDKEWS